jgi:hypothetical protein
MGRNSYAVWNLDSRSAEVKNDLRNKKVSIEEAQTRMKNVYLAYLRSCGQWNPQINLLYFANVVNTVKLHDLNQWRQLRKRITGNTSWRGATTHAEECFTLKGIDDHIDYTWLEWVGADLAYDTMSAEYGYRTQPIKMRAGAVIAKPTIKKSVTQVIPLACLGNLRLTKSGCSTDRRLLQPEPELACLSSLRSRRAK